MFRHGERTPEPEQMEEFRRYAEKDNKFEPPGLGQLTDVRSCLILSNYFQNLFTAVKSIFIY